MNLLRCVALGTSLLVLPCAELPAQSTVTLVPPFHTDSLLVELEENFSNPETGRTPDDLWQAAGVTVTAVNPTYAPGVRSVLVTPDPSTRFGQAFQAIQAFDFGAGTRWSLLLVEPVSHASSPLDPGATRLFNFSARAHVHPGEQVTIGGLIVPGEYPRLVVLRARGPSLTAFGVESVLANPRLELFRDQERILTNDDHTSLRTFEYLLVARVHAAPLENSESMIATYLDPGVYTAIVSGADGGNGVALLEMFLLDQFLIE